MFGAIGMVDIINGNPGYYIDESWLSRESIRQCFTVASYNDISVINFLCLQSG